MYTFSFADSKASRSNHCGQILWLRGLIHVLYIHSWTFIIKRVRKLWGILYRLNSGNSRVDGGFEEITLRRWIMVKGGNLPSQIISPHTKKLCVWLWIYSEELFLFDWFFMLQTVEMKSLKNVLSPNCTSHCNKETKFWRCTLRTSLFFFYFLRVNQQELESWWWWMICCFRSFRFGKFCSWFREGVPRKSRSWS